MRHPRRPRAPYPRILNVLALSAFLAAAAGAGCPIVGPVPTPVTPASFAGCWRFAVRMAAVDGTRDFVDRDFTIDISPLGQVTRVVMRKEGEGIENPASPNATFVDMISNAAAAALQNSFFAARVGQDPTAPDVVYNGVISATSSGFSVATSLVLTASSVTRYRLNVNVTVAGTDITNVTGTFVDGAGPGGELVIQRLFTGAGRIAGKVDCPPVVAAACDRFYETNAVVSNTRFLAFDPARGLAGQIIVASNATLQLLDLATSELRKSVGLAAAVQGRMAVDATRRRLYATTRNAVGNNALVVVDLDGGTIVKTIELKPAGCVDNGTRGAVAVIPSSGDVLVTTADSNTPALDGILRVEPVAGLITGAVQNAHLTNTPFTMPADLVLFEANGVALVANAGAPALTLVPLTELSRELRGGDTPACRDAIKAGTLTTTPTEGSGVNAIATDLGDSRGVIVLRGTTDLTADGRYQTYTIAGAGAAATVTLAAGTNLGRSTRLFGLEIDSGRNEAFVVNGDQAAFRVNLGTGAIIGQVSDISTSGISFVVPIVGRNRLVQAGNNRFLGEYCLP